MKQEILNILTYIANITSETVVYEWDAELCHEEICEKMDLAIAELRKHLDWNSLTDQDCTELRFGEWEEGNPLRLIPIWLYKAIPVGTKLTCIDGEEIVFDGSNIDTGIRFGCLAWGIIPKK